MASRRTVRPGIGAGSPGHPRAFANNRKLPRLPPLDQLAGDDPRRWAVVFTTARLQRGWTYEHLSARSGVGEAAVVTACSAGISSSRTMLKLLNALGITLPQLHVVSAYEAIHGRQRVVPEPAHEAVTR